MNRWFAIASLVLVMILPGCDDGRVSVVTRTEFDDIRPLMSYSEVARVVGDPGEEVGRSSPVEARDGGSRLRVSLYRWKNLDGSNMNALFCNETLVNKAQTSLK